MLVIWLKKTDFNTKVTEIEGKIPSITGLATNSELSAVEKKIPDVSSLVKNTNLNAELKKISDRITSNKIRHLQIENELKKLQKFDAAYFRGKGYFDGNDGALTNSLVFQVGEKHFKNNSGSNSSKIQIWKSKGLSCQSLDLSAIVGIANNMKMSKPIRPTYVIFNHKEPFFEQKKENIIKSRSIVSMYIVYSLQKIRNSDNVLKSCLFGATKVTKPSDTADTDKYIYSGYGLGFDSTSQFTQPQGRMARIIIIFGVNSSNSVHATNKTRNILILGHGLTQKVNATIYAEKMYSPNFSAENKIFCLSLHYNGNNSYLFVNGKGVAKFKAKKSKIKENQLTLGSISTSANLSSSDIEDSKLYGNVYDFSVDYSAISNDKMQDIHAYLMKKNDIV